MCGGQAPLHALFGQMDAGNQQIYQGHYVNSQSLLADPTTAPESTKNPAKPVFDDVIRGVSSGPRSLLGPK